MEGERLLFADSKKESDKSNHDWILPIEVFTSKAKSKEEIARLPNKDVRKFYLKQNKHIEAYEEVASEAIFAEEDEQNERNAKLAVRLSLLVNVVLFIAKLFASYSSGSLSVISSAVDSFLDLFSGFVLWYTTRKTFTNPYDFPAGKKTRMEPLGVIVFAAVMGTAVLQLVSQAAEQLYIGFSQHQVNGQSLSFIDIGILVSVVCVKFCLWIFCSMVKNSPAAAALAQDHRNDVFTNTFAMFTAFMGTWVFWWFDPLGAGLIGLYIVVFWAKSGYEQIKLLAGFRAKQTFVKQLTYIVWNHHPKILKIDTVRAFHFGSDHIVEVDVVLPANTPLLVSHDIGESLQMKLETIPSIDRAYVHLDYEYSHKPEHKIAENESFVEKSNPDGPSDRYLFSRTTNVSDYQSYP